MDTLKRIKSFTESRMMDVLLIASILTISIFFEYEKIMYNHTIFGFSFQVPIGLIAILATFLSVSATRLFTKRNNLGNFIGIFQPLLSIYIAYFLAKNYGALLTYPITIGINAITYTMWKKNDQEIPRKIDIYFWLFFLIGFILGFSLNYIGFTYLAVPGEVIPFKDIDHVRFYTFTATTTLAFGGNLASIRMYSATWAQTLLYIFIRLYNAIITGIIPDIVKYIAYAFNASLAYITWIFTEKEAAQNTTNE